MPGEANPGEPDLRSCRRRGGGRTPCEEPVRRRDGRRDRRNRLHPADWFDSLVDAASQRESTLQAPFSVYIHGDFNVDNIIFDADEKRISFIDLHRSQQTDYVQDISVFMVSNYRLQILDAPLRARILGVALDIYRIAQRFAEKSDDDTFEIRLALGLARSFVTSTRFILDKSLARAMFLRSRYLLEQLLATGPKQVQHYRVPVEEIFVG